MNVFVALRIATSIIVEELDVVADEVELGAGLAVVGLSPVLLHAGGDADPAALGQVSRRPGTGGRPQRQRALQDPALRAPRPLARSTAASSSGRRSSTGGS